MPITYKSPFFGVVFGLLMLVSITLSLLNQGTRRILGGSWRYLGAKTRTTSGKRSGRNNSSKDDIHINNSRRSSKENRRYKVASGKLIKDADGFVLNNVSNNLNRFSQGKWTALNHPQVNLHHVHE